MELGIADLLDDNKIREAQSVQEVATDAVEEQVVPEPTNEKSTPEAPKTENPTLELNDETVRNYIQSKREQDENSFSEFFKSEVKEVEKVVNPYENLMDDYDKKYFDFKKETGLTRKEFDFVQQDFSAKSSLELAQETVRRSVDTPLTDEQVNSYLEKKLNIDLSSDELDSNDEIDLSNYAKPLKEQLISQQEKYKATIAEKPTKVEKGEMVKLENGDEMPKAKYDQLVKQREEYVNNLKEGVSGATSFDVDITFDNNGEKQTAKFNYDYSEEDKHSMLSNASDVNALISKKFRTEKGFDFKGLATFIDKAENFDKYIALAYKEAQAQAIESKIASDNNEQFTQTPKPLSKTKSTAKSILDLVPNN